MRSRTSSTASFLLLLLSAFSVAIAAPNLQEGRRGFIQKLINERVFTKVEMPRTLPYVHVAPRFYLADFEDKQKFLSVVSAYYTTMNPKYDPVVVFDSRSGKKIGTYSLNYGLKLQ